MRANHIESHFLIMIASFLLITIQVENRKAQFRSSAVDIGKLSPASEMELFFPKMKNISPPYRVSSFYSDVKGTSFFCYDYNRSRLDSVTSNNFQDNHQDIRDYNRSVLFYI